MVSMTLMLAELSNNWSYSKGNIAQHRLLECLLVVVVFGIAVAVVFGIAVVVVFAPTPAVVPALTDTT